MLIAHILLTAAIKAAPTLTPGWIRGLTTTCRDRGRFWMAKPTADRAHINLYSGPDPANYVLFARVPLAEVRDFVADVLLVPGFLDNQPEVAVSEPAQDPTEAVMIPPGIVMPQGADGVDILTREPDEEVAIPYAKAESGGADEVPQE